MTRRFEIGKLYYYFEDPLGTTIVQGKINCPKCEKDISNGNCAVKWRYFMMSLIAANISVGVSDGVPSYLQGAVPVTMDQYDRIAPYCKSRLNGTVLI